MTNDVQHLKIEILVRLVEAFLSDDFVKNARLIPYDMRPKGAKVPYRCCIYKERAILKDRLIAALGFAIEDDNEAISLSEYAANSLKRNCPEEIPLTVLGAACKACVSQRIHVTDLCQGCVARPCKSACKFGAIEIINGKSTIDSSKCKACKMCISVCPYNAIVKVAVPCEDSCPVNAIEKNIDGTAKIDFEECIFCGKCVSRCPFGAVLQKSQLIDVLRLLKNKDEVSLLFAPATVGEFPGTIGQLKTAMKKLGFTNLYEVAQGADITAKNEAKEFQEKMASGQPFMTTSCCAGYNEFVKKHLQGMTPYKSTTRTPLFYTAEIAKKEHPDSKVVFVSPCIAKKQETKENPNVDYVISIMELGALFIASHIEILNCEEDKSGLMPSKQGRKFPLSGGVAEAVKTCTSCETCPTVINGINKDTIKQLKRYVREGKCDDGNLIEVMCCEGGCIAGNGTIADSRTATKLITELLNESDGISKD